MDEQAFVDREGGLERGLTKAQIIMIGLGGAIGTGLFMGSGIAIGYAGPAVLVSYAIAALIAVIMVFSLSEMAVVHPTAGSFGTYAEIYLGPMMGFIVRYTYWIQQVLLIGSEAVAVGIYMSWWYPDTPVWMWAIGSAAVVVWVNTRAVHNFGSVEYWLTVIKVSAIVGFIMVGLSRIFGIVGDPVGLHNVTGLAGGFFPNGFSGVWMAVLTALFFVHGAGVRRRHRQRGEGSENRDPRGAAHDGGAIVPVLHPRAVHHRRLPAVDRIGRQGLSVVRTFGSTRGVD